jgi:hypothetical protein
VIVSVIVIMPVAAIVIITIMFVFVVVAKIPVMIMVPMVVVFNSAPVPGPVTPEVPLAIVVRGNPVGSYIGRPSPVVVMPFVMVSHWIPVAFHPYEIWFRLRRLNVHDAGRRWRSDHNSNRNLGPNR